MCSPGLPDLVGIPWRVGGRDFDGVDCVGLVVLAQRVLFGRDYSEIAEPGPVEDYEARSLEILDRLPAVMERVTEIRHGDILLFRFAACVHIGTYLEGGKVLQIFDNTESRITDYGRYFRDRQIAIYRGVKLWA